MMHKAGFLDIFNLGLDNSNKQEEKLINTIGLKEQNNDEIYFNDIYQTQIIQNWSIKMLLIILIKKYRN